MMESRVFLHFQSYPLAEDEARFVWLQPSLVFKCFSQNPGDEMERTQPGFLQSDFDRVGKHRSSDFKY
jgi:hypothetical protein